MSEVKAVEFVAEVWQVKTMADRTINLTLKIPEYCTPQAKQFIDWLLCQVKIVAEIQEKPELEYKGRLK